MVEAMSALVVLAVGVLEVVEALPAEDGLVVGGRAHARHDHGLLLGVEVGEVGQEVGGGQVLQVDALRVVGRAGRQDRRDLQQQQQERVGMPCSRAGEEWLTLASMAPKG